MSSLRHATCKRLAESKGFSSSTGTFTTVRNNREYTPVVALLPGNGTQEAFYDDESVLFISIHRFDGGRFYPNTKDADYTEIGSGKAKGRNINIPWPTGGFGDGDYLYMFQNIIMPIAYEFNPDMVLGKWRHDSDGGWVDGGWLMSDG